MIGWLLDTNVLSELRRQKPEPRVLAFVAAQPLEQLYVSTVTLAEIRFGIELVTDANRRAELTDWLSNKVRPMFEQRVLPITEDIMFKWRLLVAQGRKSGHTFSQPDLIIAATGLHHGLTVVSRDTSDPLTNNVLDVSGCAREKRSCTGRMSQPISERPMSGGSLAIEIGDPRIADLHISGVFRVDDPEGVLRTLQEAFGMRVERQGNAITLLPQVPFRPWRLSPVYWTLRAISCILD